MAADEEETLKSQGRNELLLPVSRIRVIMKSSPDVENIAQDALHAITGATELFIKDLARKVYSSKTDESSDVDYDQLAALVNSKESYGFLDEIIPEKISGRDILAQRKAQNSNGHASDNEEAEAKSEEEEEEEDGS